MKDMSYIFITYEAVELFASDRFLQSSENEVSNILCNIVRLKGGEWSHPRIHLKTCDKGLVFFTKDSSYKKGILFDLTTFKGFTDEQDDRTIINIFQKTIKYGVRFFDNYPLAGCEKELPGTYTTIIYPNPFVASHGVPKIVLDRDAGKYKKKECSYLTVFDYSTDGKSKVSYASLNKAYEEIRFLNFQELSKEYVKPQKAIRGFSTSTLDYTDLTIDANIGYEAWVNHYLTDVQKKFVCSEIDGPERLEGAAGTGKTLCLILRCIYLLKQHIDDDSEYHIIFFTHSLSTKERIVGIFRSNWEDFELCNEEKESTRPKQSVKVTTLQEWSAEHLGTNSIDDNEFLDKDAASSKQLQIYYIEEAYKKVKADLWNNTFDILCSDKFKNFINITEEENILELLRQEIAVMIKGRAGGDFDKFKLITRPKYSIPLKVEADYKFIYFIYKKYQASLEKVGQYDSDDITLTALGQVDTPIWNRRRIKDGYDACIIDEVHLFNINELSVFHFVNKPVDEENNGSQKIVFAIDKSQATGDWGVDDISIRNAFRYSDKEKEGNFNTVFRCSPDIVNLAFNILSSGATLFTFENPLSYSTVDFVKEDEQKSIVPEYIMLQSDKDSVADAVNWAEKYCKEHNTAKNKVLLIGTNDSTVDLIYKYFRENNKPFEKLESRSDATAMKAAADGNKFVISQIDYVGGLEFDAVLILGVDDGRVPPSKNEKDEAYHVIKYAWHSRMYVAVTRAKYAVRMYGEFSRDPSPLLQTSILSGNVKYNCPTQ